MKLAPLQLERYFITELNCQASAQYKADKETKFREKDLEVSASVSAIKDRPGHWQVSLNVKLQPAAEVNSPYSFCLNLVGIVAWVGPKLPEDKVEVMIRTNGPSMLYGVAREVGRDLTARGPFPALMLPSVSFLADALAATVPTAVAAAAKTAEGGQQQGAEAQVSVGAGGKR